MLLKFGSQTVIDDSRLTGAPTKTISVVKKTNVKTIICIFCGAAYRVGHIKFINGAKRIDDFFIICEELRLNLKSGPRV